jgi:hypothetical protein
MSDETDFSRIVCCSVCYHRICDPDDDCLCCRSGHKELPFGVFMMLALVVGLAGFILLIAVGMR